MVRWIWVTVRGRDVLAEDAPQVCPAGHEVVQRPGWGACPACSQMGRTWACTDCGAVTIDDEHVHGSQRR